MPYEKLNDQDIEAAIALANQSTQELRNAKALVRDQAYADRSMSDYAGDVGRTLYGMKDIGLFHDIIPGAAKSAKQAFTLPARVFRGEVPEDQMIAEALNFAGMVTGGAGAIPAEMNALRAGASLPVKKFSMVDAANARGMTPKEVGKGLSDIARPQDEWRYAYQEPVNTVKPQQFDPNILKPGDVFVPLFGDRTISGRTLTEIGGNKLAEPVVTEGGPTYMLNPNNQIWASGQSVISGIANKAEGALKASEKLGYKDPNAYGVYVPMGKSSGDFSTHTADAIISMLPNSPISAKAAKAFNDAMKEQLPDFPGIKSPKLREYLMEPGAGAKRIIFSKTMDKKPWREAGFPDVGEARFATTNPDLLSTPDYAGGYTVGRIDRANPVIKKPAMGHRSYPVALGGEYVGGFPVSLHKDLIFPNWTAYYDRVMNPERANYVPAKYKSYSNVMAYQPFGPRSIADFQERILKAQGKADGGAVEGADIEAAMQTSRQNFDNGGSAFPLSISGGGSLAPIDDEFVQGYGGGAGGRFGLRLPFGKGSVDAGISGSISGYDMDTPEGRNRDIEGDIGGGDISYSRDGRTYGASYSEQPNMRGDKERTLMFNYSMPFASGGRIHKEGGGVAINQDQIDQGIIAANQSLQELRGAKQAVQEQAAGNQSWGDWASQMGKNLYGMKDIGLFHDIIPGAIQSAKQAATMPYREQMAAASGQPWTDQQSIGEAFNTAGMFTLGAGAIPAEANALRAGAGMYSKAERAAAGLPMDKMQGPQALGMLEKVVGPDELKWTGLADRLASTPQLTKQQLVDMIRQNDVQLNEVIRGGKPLNRNEVRPTETASAPFLGEWNKLVEERELLQAEVNQALSEGRYTDWRQDPIIAAKDQDITSRMDDLHEKMIDATIDEMGGLGLETKFGPRQNKDWSLRGGKNYQETVITTPETKATIEEWPVIDKDGIGRGTYTSKEAAEAAAQKIGATVGEKKNTEVLRGFRGQHWSEPNVIAHIRTNEFSGFENGKYFTPSSEKVFNLDELQSDWAQKGKKKGFSEPVTSLPEGYTIKEQPLRGGDIRYHVYDENGQLRSTGFSRQNAINSMVNNLNDTGGVIAGPYVKSTSQWVDLGLKKAVSQAIDSGSDVFTWTPGKVNADRYSLANNLKRVEYEPNDDGTFEISAIGKDAEEVYNQDAMSLNDIEEYFGKDLAEKIKTDQGTKMEGRPLRDWRYFEGEGLKAKGDGMVDFYENIVPKRLSEVIRKATGEKPQFQTWTIQTADGPLEVQGFRFTPEMKAKLQAIKEKEGGYFPHFANGGKVDDSSINKALQIAAEASV